MAGIMTPEQWNQLITILITGVSGAFVFIGLMGRAFYKYFNARIDNYAKTQESEREKLKNEYKLRFVEVQSEAKREEELFALNRAHAESYNIVANTLDRLENNISGNLADQTSQIEVFSGQLLGIDKKIDSNYQVIGSDITKLVQSFNSVTKKIDEHIQQTNTLVSDLLERDEANVNANTQSRQEILTTIRSLQADLNTFKEVRKELENVLPKLSDLLKTKPLPQLDDNGNPIAPSDSAPDTNGAPSPTQDNNDKDKIA